MTNQNLQRLQKYQNKKRMLEDLEIEYPRPLMLKKDYENWRKNLKVGTPSPTNLLKLIIP